MRVVVTARDLNRTLVSMWQETIQNGRTWTWAEYVADAEAKRPRAGAGAADRRTPGGTFWRQQDLVRMVADWSGVVGTDNVALATVPPAWRGSARCWPSGSWRRQASTWTPAVR